VDTPRPASGRTAPAGDNWARVKAVFLSALELEEPRRHDFVEDACGGDRALSEEVYSLLASDESAAGFCETPAARLLHEGASQRTVNRRLQPGSRLAGYEIVELVGAGGMGEVYRARDSRLNRDVALKTLPLDAADADAGRRLIREARHASILKHPNVCTIHEIGEADNIPFIVMEFVDGRSLHEIENEGPVGTDDALRYGIQVADALDHAHSRGIIHRDLKSSNVVVEQGGRAIVLDFGLAKRLPSRDGSTESFTNVHHGPVGTLSYMAPEVLRGIKADVRSDIWSLGVLLYRLVSGELPFAGQTTFETSSAILGDHPKPPRGAVPLALRLVIERCLAKDPEQRYQSAADVRTDLQSMLQRRGWRVAAGLLIPSRRFVAAAAAVAICTVALVLGLAWLGTGARDSPGTIGTVAVLPLEDATRDPEKAFYASGLTDALISQLGAAGDLRVMSRTSVDRTTAATTVPRSVGEELGADAVINGTLSRSADRLRLDLRLTDVRRGQVLWSDSFERSARDILVLQADAVRAVAAGVRASLRPGARERLTMVPVIQPEVYEQYLRGRYEWNRRTSASLQTAIQHFGRATELDATYAPAHAALADCYNQLATVMVGGGSPKEYRPKAEAAAIRALRIDPGSSEAHAALGYVRHYQWQWADAEGEFLRAIELNPSNSLARLWYANLLMSRQRFDEALRQVYAARDLDPFSLVVNTNIGWILTFAGRHTEAVQQLTRTVALDPEYPQARWRLADVLVLLGRYEEALVEADASLRVTNRSPSSLAMLASIYSATGRQEDAREILRELQRIAAERYVPPSTFAGVYRALGEIDTSLDWMERAVDEGSNYAAYIAVEPGNGPLRTHPRFQALLQRTGQR
jgi:non-specific serine/threonine protein kinase